ncbi:hypothetical protein MAQ58_23940, partial [Enterobacter sp. DRP3]|nr:hypothetical protein [Enterobacter sp. DRP3]
ATLDLFARDDVLARNAGKSATLRAALAPLGKRVSTVVLPDGETYKNWETLNLIFDGLLTDHADRKTTLVALGGGVGVRGALAPWPTHQGVGVTGVEQAPPA